MISPFAAALSPPRANSYRADIGVREGRIAANAERIADASREIDASGLIVMPGGIDSHVHLPQPAAAGLKMADDFFSGTCAIAGGNTTVLAAGAGGKTAPYYHSVSRPELVERAAAHHAISHAELIDVPIMIVHVSGRQAMEQIRWAQRSVGCRTASLASRRAFRFCGVRGSSWPHYGQRIRGADLDQPCQDV